MTQWAQENAIQFDPDKSEVLHIGRSKTQALPRVPVELYGKTTIPSRSIRWLGVHLDSTLSFKKHVEVWCSKARNLACLLWRACPVLRGAAPHAMVQLMEACVLSVAMYGSDVWWQGTHKLSHRGLIRCRNAGLVEMVERIITMAIRVALPVFRTTPNVALHREAGIPPADLLLEGMRLRQSARLHRLDNAHPLRSRALMGPCEEAKRLAGSRKDPWKDPRQHQTRVQRTFSLLPYGEPPNRLKSPIPRVSFDKESPADILAFSDGSSAGPSRSAWGFHIRHLGSTLREGHGALPGGEVFDAEIEGALQALSAAVDLVRRNPTPPARAARIKVLLDNQAAVRGLQTGRTSSSGVKVDKFHRIAAESGCQVTVTWIPGHKGIPRNERADWLAKKALQDLPPTDSIRPYTMAAIKRKVTSLQESNVKKWWQKNAPEQYSTLGLHMRRRKPPELQLPRQLHHTLVAARTGHGDFASYHRRFNHPDANLICICGMDKQPTHFLRCRESVIGRKHSRQGVGERIYKVLGPKAILELPKALGHVSATGRSSELET